MEIFKFWKNFFKPSNKSIIIFIILFSLVFLVPFLKTDVSDPKAAILPPGHYPLILVFIFASAVFLELFSGMLNLTDLIFFFSFILIFIFLYILACTFTFISEKYRFNKNINNKTALDNNENLVLNIKDKQID